MKHVNVQLTTRQGEGETRSETRMAAVGSLEQTENGLVLCYIEPPQEDGSRAHVRMTLRPQRVFLERGGEFSSRMVFEPGRRCLCQYDTPYGALVLHTRCRELENTVSKYGGRLYVAYDLESGAEQTENCMMEILIEEVSV